MALNHWKQHHFDMLRAVTDFPDMLRVAFDVIDSMPEPRGQICGPIRTGGGTIEENLARLTKAIDRLHETGVVIFDQMPLHEPMQRIFEIRQCKEYPQFLLDEFYLPLFESGKIDTFYFVPNWQESRGACWEHEQALRLGRKIVYLTKAFILGESPTSVI